MLWSQPSTLLNLHFGGSFREKNFLPLDLVAPFNSVASLRVRSELGAES